MKEILWLTRHILEPEEREELEKAFGKDINFRFNRLNILHAEDVFVYGEDCDVIAAVLKPELFSEIFRLNQERRDRKLILRENGVWVATGNRDSKGIPEVRHQHKCFEVVRQYVYETEDLTGKRIGGVKKILVQSGRELLSSQVDGLKSIYGGNVEIIQNTEKITDVDAFARNCKEYDVIYPNLPTRLVETLFKKVGKPVIRSVDDERRTDGQSFHHAKWILIRDFQVKTENLLKKGDGHD